MRKLILKCAFAPGDLIMLTAAVRDLHRCYPESFLTDVRTCCPDIWEHNPYITPLSETNPDVETLECSYPLINRANEAPYHCLHGFIEFFNDRLGLAIKPSLFRGDIHLSIEERAWYSQVHELTGADTPFWIVAAGGKYDIPIKWWDISRYQQVVDSFSAKILFVQVGGLGNHHPHLERTMDLRGKTSLRQLIRLVYHSQGVLCSVTSLMHLAAAVPVKPGRPANRACVVVAGGREPAHWEAYPHHQFIHTNGTLECCANGGCWRDRVFRLRDGDSRDRKGRLCVDVLNGLPHCMDMITSEEVVRRISLYYSAGSLNFLNSRQQKEAYRGISSTSENDFDCQPLTLSGAGMACDSFVKSIPPSPGGHSGRGIVICGGGIRYFTSAWVCINMLRRLGCRLPIELWYLEGKEMTPEMKEMLAPLGVDCIDSKQTRRKFPARLGSGWALKPYSILYSRFKEIIFLDADNVPVANPEYLFDSPEYRRTGAVFWPDYDRERTRDSLQIWRSTGIRLPREREFESGQMVLDKARCWQPLRLALWFNENSAFYYRYLHGDKETFQLAFRKLKVPYSLVPHPIHVLPHTMCQHDFRGRRIFQHRNMDKWDLNSVNKRIKGFWYENECRGYLDKLQENWDFGWNGSLRAKLNQATQVITRSVTAPKVQAVMISSPSRSDSRESTLASLKETDWPDLPLHIEMAVDLPEKNPEPLALAAGNALRYALSTAADYVLFLEDDLVFSPHLRHNISKWKPFQRQSFAIATVFNPCLPELAWNVEENARIIHAGDAFSSKALLIPRNTAAHFVKRWDSVTGPHDIRMTNFISARKQFYHCHAPSLVARISGGKRGDRDCYQAMDFRPEWRA